MYAFLSFLLLCLAVSTYGAAVDHVVGGEDAEIGKYPYQVSLRIKGKHSCGGSIINKRYVLSAAHCFMGLRWRRVNDIKVHAGTNFLNEDGVVYDVEKVIRHPDFNLLVARNDIAVLRVTRDIEFNDKVQPVPTATTNFAKEGDVAVVTGWGTLKFGGKVPNNLQEAALEVASQDKCKRIHRRVGETQICTSTRGRKGVCHGDSGGPLVMNGVQIGIVSYGFPCALGAPDVYTRVFSFQDWIKENTK